MRLILDMLVIPAGIGLAVFAVAMIIADLWRARHPNQVDPELCDIAAADRAYAAGYRDGMQYGRALQSDLTYQAVAPMAGACQTPKVTLLRAVTTDGLATIEPVTA